MTKNNENENVLNKKSGEGIFIVTETWEGKDAIREFTNHSVTKDLKKSENLIESLYEEDQYGYFKNNGTSEKNNRCICSNFNESFVEYSIYEMKLEKIE